MATDTQQRFVERAVRRKKLFLVLSIVGIVIAVVFAASPVSAGSMIPPIPSDHAR